MDVTWEGRPEVSFETDIRPLFTQWDRTEMDWLFDLWSYEEVKQRAPAILERLEEETMPCDVPWDAERIDRFRRWLAEGCPP